MRRLVWRTPLDEATTAPAVDGTAIYLASMEQTVIAVDKQRGEVIWRRALPAERIEVIDAVVRTAECVLVPTWDLWCLDPATGSTRWHFSRDTLRASKFTPVAADGVIYTSAYGGLFAIDEATGVPRWSIDFGANVFSPRVRDGVVYVAMTRATAGQDSGKVAAIDAGTGQIRWVQGLPVTDPSIGSGTAHPVIAGSVLVASSRDSHLHAFDLADGTLRWTAPRGAPPGKPDSTVTRDLRLLATDGARVFAGSAIGTVSAYSAADGSHQWTTATIHRGSPFFVVHDAGRVYTVTAGFQLSVFDAVDGRNVWNCDSYDLGPLKAEFGFAPGFDAAALYLGGNGIYKFRKE